MTLCLLTHNIPLLQHQGAAFPLAQTMPYNTVVAPSSVFPENPDYWPPVWTTESRAAFVNHGRPPSAPQRYRGGMSTPKVMHAQPVMRQPVTPVMAQLQSLQERLLRLQKQLDKSASSCAKGNAQATLDAVVAQIAALECCTGTAELENIEKDPRRGSGSYDSFAQFAAEASRVRHAGRLPFGSDHVKIR